MEANRALIVVGAPRFLEPAIGGRPVPVQFGYDNTGRETATEVKVSTFFDVIEWPKEGNMLLLPKVGEEFCKTHPPNRGLGALSPGNGDSVFNTTSAEEKINWDSSLDAEKNLLRVRGCMSYKTFEKTHYTWFCNVFSLPLMLIKNGVKTATGRRLGASCNDGTSAD